MQFEIYQDKRGEYRWRLRAQNKMILAVSSEGYKHHVDCVRCLESTRKAGATAGLVDLRGAAR